MDLLDYLKPDELRGRLAAALRNMPVAQLARGELPTKQGLTDTLLAQKPFNAQDLTGAMEGANWANPMLAAKIVYHGSPHKFDKFDASKIGTGEGAQAYGHGVYLAEAPDVAEGYAKNLSTKRTFVDGKPVDLSMGDDRFTAAMSIAAQGYKKYTDDILSAMKSGIISKADGEKWLQDAAEFKDSKFHVESTGQTYKADLPDEWIPKMLDWDKPLSQQPENVRLLAQDLGLAKDATGKDVYSALSNQARDMGIIKGQPLQTTLPGSQEQATADLLGFGVPGIRYMDGGSRMTPTQEEAIRKALERATAKGDEGVAKSLRAQLENRTSNYVVFPGLEDKVKILERNGQPINPLADALRKYP